MTGRMNWKRTRRCRYHQSKYGEGVVLRNGEVTPQPPLDPLARRAEKAMRAWLPTLKPWQRVQLAK